MRAGAPLGNQNGAKGKRWQKALERVLARRYGDVDKGLEKLAEKFLKLADNKAVAKDVYREVADRFDGRPAQAVALTGADDGPLIVEIVKFKDV